MFIDHKFERDCKELRQLVKWLEKNRPEYFPSRLTKQQIRFRYAIDKLAFGFFHTAITVQHATEYIQDFWITWKELSK